LSFCFSWAAMAASACFCCWSCDQDHGRTFTVRLPLA
jgi:hypothetical protein